MAHLTIFAVFVALVATTRALYIVPNAGCLYDGRMYGRGDIIQIAGCLGEMTCLGNNNLSPIRLSSKPECNYLYQADGQTGCLFDGRIYATGDIIQIAGCLGEMTCLGNNNLSSIRPSSKPECNYVLHFMNVMMGNGQTGCLFDGKVYKKGEVVQIKRCLGEMTCLGDNIYTELRPSSLPECN